MFESLVGGQLGRFVLREVDLEFSQLGDFGIESCPAPVRHFAVKLMSPGLHCEIGVGREARLDERSDEAWPAGVRLFDWSSTRRRLGFGLARAAR
jgi:hypothetical protein